MTRQGQQSGYPTLPEVSTALPQGTTHRDYLLDQALRSLSQGRYDVAVTHLSHAVLVAATEGEPFDRRDLERRVRALLSHGDVE